MSSHHTQRSLPRRGPTSEQAGLSLVELLIALTVLTISANGLASFFTAVPRMMDEAQRKRTVMDEAMGMYEELRGQEFESLFVRYNESALDDPALGDAPGNQRILTETARSLGSGPGRPASISLFFPAPASSPMELREDTVDPNLGMPRDLNGDGVIDGLNHASDYVILPVRIEVKWSESGADRTHSEILTLTENWQ